MTPDEDRLDGERAQQALAERVAGVLLPEVLERSSELAGALGRLSYDFDSNDDLPEAWAEREFASLQDQSFAGGWWLAVLTSALGSDGVGSRRERRALRGLDLVLGSAADRRLVRFEFVNELDDLAADFGEGWRVPFLVASLAVECLGTDPGLLRIVCRGHEVALHSDPRGPELAELRNRCAPALQWVPGARLELPTPAELRLTLPDAAFSAAG